MSRFGVLTDEAVNRALDSMRRNRKLALDANDQGLAQSFQDLIDGLIEELVLRNTDPHTTAADIRYFENNA